MFELFPLVLATVVAVSIASAAIIAAWRMIPYRGGPNIDLARLDSLEDGIEAQRLALVDLGDRYEITIRRNATRVGKLRTKVRRLEGDDDDEHEDEDLVAGDVVPVIAPASPATQTKAQMWAAYNQAQRSGGYS